MRADRNRARHKLFHLDSEKIRRAQKILGAKTETETIECALDAVIAECECERLAKEANERFIQSGIQLNDVFGKLKNRRLKCS